MATIPNYRNLPKRDLSIYLLKEEVSQDVVFTKLRNIPHHQIQTAGIGGRLFIRQDPLERLPPWTRLFEGQLPVDGLGRVASLSAVFVIEVSGRLFVLAFGTGRFLLDDEWLEERFGFFAVLNLVDSTQIRAVDKQTLDSLGRQTRVQTSKATPVREFGVDYERDLLRAVVGKPRDEDLGTFVTGTASLRTTVRIDLANLPRLLTKYLEKFRSRSYRREFPGIDQLKAVTNARRLNELDREIVRRLNAPDLDNISLAVPQIVDWQNIAEFRYEGTGDDLDHHELSLADLVRIAADIGLQWTAGDLDRIRIRTINPDGIPSARWTMRACLFGELQVGGKHWILSSGTWYEVSHDLVQEVEDAFNSVPRFQPALPMYGDTDEAAYCVRVAAQDAVWARMDRVPITFGRGRSLVEFCDLFSLQTKTLLHVKRYAGSAPLSHLFQQALVSGEAFRTSEEFRGLANAKIPEGYRLADHVMRPDGFTVVLGIVKANGLDLPFFSKVTLRNTVRLLSGFAFNVRLAHIPVREDWARIAAARQRSGRGAA